MMMVSVAMMMSVTMSVAMSVTMSVGVTTIVTIFSIFPIFPTFSVMLKCNLSTGARRFRTLPMAVNGGLILVLWMIIHAIVFVFNAPC